MADKDRSRERAFQRAVAADGRIVPIRGHVLAKDARGVAEKMAKAAPILESIKASFAPRPDDVGQSED